MRRPGSEFGSDSPSVIYLALRWNAAHSKIAGERKMIATVAKKLRVSPTELRIYNLVRPEKGRGMDLSVPELPQVERTITGIVKIARTHSSLHRIAVGGTSGPMPQVALLLKFLLPNVRIEIRAHHKARAVNGGPLRLVKVLRP